MTDNLVAALRAAWDNPWPLCQRAADELERLTAELAKFQHHIACKFQVTGGLEPCDCGLDDAESRAGDHAEEIVRLAAKCDRLARERDDYCRQLTQGIRAMRDVCAERDRLTRERDELQNGYSVRDDEVSGLLAMNAELRAERDRLTAENAALDALAKYNREMAERLRAALERIAQQPQGVDIAARIADQALAGGGEKTPMHRAWCGSLIQCEPRLPCSCGALAGGGEYSPEAVKRILAARDGPSHEVCCDKFPDCECPERAGGGEK